MSKKTVEIKQSLSRGVKLFEHSIERTTLPNSFRIYFPKKSSDGFFITGLTKEEEKKYGDLLREDLSPNSEFWVSLQIRLVDKTNPVIFNLENPLDYVKYKCALSNKFIAPNLDSLKEPDYYYTDCCLYVHDPVGDLKRENELRELRDECTSLIFQMKLQKEKMFYILFKTGSVTNELWTEGELYKNLSLYLSSLKKPESIKEFLEILKQDNTKIMIEYGVNKAMGSLIKKIESVWTYAGQPLGLDKEKVLEYFYNNQDLYELLKEDLKIKL